MARMTTQIERFPSEARFGAERIKKHGFEPGYIEDYPLVSQDRRMQIRAISSVAPRNEVVKYQQALKRGDLMPPVIVTSDGWLVDGATRTEAARRLGWKKFPALVLDVLYEHAGQEQLRRLMELGADFNDTHGRGMSTANLMSIINATADDHDTPSTVALRMKIPTSRATTLLNAVKATRRARRLGVELDNSLTNSHLKLLGGKEEKLMDPVFGKLVTLAQDAHLSIGALTELCKRVQSLGTENERLTLLDTERGVYRDVISGGERRPSKAAKVRQHLGFLLHEDNPELMVEFSVDAAADYRQVLINSRKRIDQILEAQLRADDARMVRQEG